MDGLLELKIYTLGEMMDGVEHSKDGNTFLKGVFQKLFYTGEKVFSRELAKDFLKDFQIDPFKAIAIIKKEELLVFSSVVTDFSDRHAVNRSIHEWAGSRLLADLELIGDETPLTDDFKLELIIRMMNLQQKLKNQR